MRFSFLLIGLVQFVFLCGYAQTKHSRQNLKSIRIQDYLINPQKDLSMLSEKEKASYVAFLYNLNLLVDAGLNQNSILIQASDSKGARVPALREELMKFLSPINEANAVVPLLPIAGSAVATGVRVVAPQIVSYVGRREVFMGMAEVVKPTVSIWSRFSKLKGAGSVASVASLPVVAASMINRDQVVPSSTNSSSAESSQEPQLQGRPASAEASQPGFDYRQEGAFCIFGGYASKYRNIEGRSFCPAPKDAVDSEICKNRGISPSFLCQSFGLSTSKSQSLVSDSLCIPLRSEKGLKDLTVRCTKAFLEFSEKARALDVEKLKEIQDQIVTGINTLEAERGANDVGILAYCADQNKANKGAQKSECSALDNLMKQYKRELPALAASAERPSSQPSNRAPSAPAAGTN